MADNGNSVAGTATEDRLKELYSYRSRLTVDSMVVVSGSMVCPGQRSPDAVIQAIWLEERGISAQEIIKEERAVDTFQNVRFSLRLIKRHWSYRVDPPHKLVIFSEKNHLRRFWWAMIWVNYARSEPYWVEYVEAGPRQQGKGLVVEWAYFLLVHLPDPLGLYHPVALVLRYMRRRQGRQ